MRKPKAKALSNEDVLREIQRIAKLLNKEVLAKFKIDHLTEAELIELNHKIVERLRLMRQIRSHKEMFRFKIGDRVTFYTSGHESQTGTLTRFNQKSVTWSSLTTAGIGTWLQR